MALQGKEKKRKEDKWAWTRSGDDPDDSRASGPDQWMDGAYSPRRLGRNFFASRITSLEV